MEMPRRFSSGSRSVSLPVSARTSQVLPWSMWPAVPTVSGIEPRSPPDGGDRGCDLAGLVVRQRAAVEQEAPVANDADDRRLVVAQRRCEGFLDGAGVRRQLGEGERAASDAADGLLDVAAECGGQPLGARADGGRLFVQHPQ